MMKLIRGLHNLPAEATHSVITIGNFDGVHKGHQALISHCISLAKKHQTYSMLITFEPHPQSFFSKKTPITRLTSLRDKYFVLQTLGLDYCCILPFNAALAALSASDFIRKILVDRLKIKTVVVGDDFRFGVKRVGDFALLHSFSQQYNYEAVQMSTLIYKEERISSSRLRTALMNKNLFLAEALLGRKYALSGHIVKGDQRGREFGYPTANIYVDQKKISLSGIFIVQVEGIDNKPLPGVASVGHRPMYPSERDMLEVYLLDFDRDIYKKHCTVTFLKHLREEQYFSSEAELIGQIGRDVASAREFFTVK